MAGNQEIPATAPAVSTGELLKEGAQAALYAAFEEPVKGGAQLLAAGVNTAIKVTRLNDGSKSGFCSGHWLPKVDFIHSPATAKSASQEWAQTIGGAIGQLVPLMAVGALSKCASRRFLGEREALLFGRSRTIGFNLAEAAATGFVNDAVLKESDPDKNIVGARLLNGTGGAITFTAMTAGSLLLDGAAGKMAGHPFVSGMLRNRILAGAVSGVPGALLGAEYDSFVKTGHRAHSPELKKAAMQMAVIGGLFGAKETLFGKPPTIGIDQTRGMETKSSFTPVASVKVPAELSGLRQPLGYPEPFDNPRTNARLADEQNARSLVQNDNGVSQTASGERDAIAPAADAARTGDSDTSKTNVRVREKRGWNSDTAQVDEVEAARSLARETTASPNAATEITFEQAKALHTLAVEIMAERTQLAQLQALAKLQATSPATRDREQTLQTALDEHRAQLKSFTEACAHNDANSRWIATKLTEEKELGSFDPYRHFTDTSFDWLTRRAQVNNRSADYLRQSRSDRPTHVENGWSKEFHKSEDELSSSEIGAIAYVMTEGLESDKQSFQHLRQRGLAADTLIELASGDKSSIYDIWSSIDESARLDKVLRLWERVRPVFTARRSLLTLEQNPPKAEFMDKSKDTLTDHEMEDLDSLRRHFPVEAVRMKDQLAKRGPISETTAQLVLASQSKAELTWQNYSLFRLNSMVAARALDQASRRVYELDKSKERRSDNISREELSAYAALKCFQPRNNGVIAAYEEMLKQRGPQSAEMLEMLSGNKQIQTEINFSYERLQNLKKAIYLKHAIQKLAAGAEKAFPTNLFEITDKHAIPLSSEAEAERFVKLYSRMAEPRDSQPSDASDFWMHGADVLNVLKMSGWNNLASLSRPELNAISDHMGAVFDEDREKQLSTPFDGRDVAEAELQKAARVWQVSRTMPFDVAKEVGAMPLEKRVVAAAAWEDVRESYLSYDFSDDGRLLRTLSERQGYFAERFLSDFRKRFAEIEKDGRKQAIARLKQSSAIEPAIAAVQGSDRGETTPQSSGRTLTAEQQIELAQAVRSLGTPLRFDIIASLRTSAYQDALQTMNDMEQVFRQRRAGEAPSEPTNDFDDLAPDQRLEFPLQLALNFKGASKEWLAKQLDAGRSLHDAIYWLPLDTSPEMKGLDRYLMRNPGGKLTDLELIAKRWKDVPEELRRHNAKVIAQHLREKTFSTVTDASFAAEAARAGIEDKDYRDMEERYLDSLKVPVPFPLDVVWKCGDLQGRFLPRNDTRGLFLGHYTNSCQHPDGAGSDAAWHGQENPRGGFFVVEDKRGEIIAESWVWIADNGALVFDNVEAKGMATRMGAAQGVYQAAADDLQKEYGLVLLGTSNSDIDIAGPPEAGEKKAAKPKNYIGYSDAHEQLVLAGSAPSAKHAIAPAPETETNS